MRQLPREDLRDSRAAAWLSACGGLLHRQVLDARRGREPVHLCKGQKVKLLGNVLISSRLA